MVYDIVGFWFNITYSFYLQYVWGLAWFTLFFGKIREEFKPVEVFSFWFWFDHRISDFFPRFIPLSSFNYIVCEMMVVCTWSLHAHFTVACSRLWTLCTVSWAEWYFGTWINQVFKFVSSHLDSYTSSCTRLVVGKQNSQHLSCKGHTRRGHFWCSSY